MLAKYPTEFASYTTNSAGDDGEIIISFRGAGGTGTLYEPRSSSNAAAFGWPAGATWSPQLHVHIGGTLGVASRTPLIAYDLSPAYYNGNTARQSPYKGLL